MASPQDLLAPDESHPIPDLDVIDIHGERLDGGHDLVIVVATPMQADSRSRARLTAKVSGYLTALEALQTSGTGGRSSIVVKIHHSTDPDVFTLLDAMRSRVEECGASLVVDRIA